MPGRTVGGAGIRTCAAEITEPRAIAAAVDSSTRRGTPAICREPRRGRRHGRRREPSCSSLAAVRAVELPSARRTRHRKSSCRRADVDVEHRPGRAVQDADPRLRSRHSGVVPGQAQRRLALGTSAASRPAALSSRSCRTPRSPAAVGSTRELRCGELRVTQQEHPCRRATGHDGARRPGRSAVRSGRRRIPSHGS